MSKLKASIKWRVASPAYRAATAASTVVALIAANRRAAEVVLTA